MPARDTVQLTIYNSEDLTLVRETRRVVFKEGNNPLQFSWANTLIDPTSVRLRFLTHADQLDVLDTTFPHDRPQELTWNVGSEYAGAATLEISYFTSGISWQAAYDVFVAPDEQHARVEGHVAVSNHSGEAYPDAQVRLVVGSINLVERVADLARRAGYKTDDDLPGRARDEMRMKATRQAFALAEVAADSAARRRPQTNRQAGPQRVLHLHHRRHRDPAQQLAQTPAQLPRRRSAAQRPVPLPPPPVRQPPRPLPAHEKRRAFGHGRVAPAQRHRQHLPPRRPTAAWPGSPPSRCPTSPSAKTSN